MMKETKNKKSAVALITIFCLLFLQVSCVEIIKVYAAETEPQSIENEQKIYEAVNIEDDFDDSCVLVVMDKYSSATNKNHDDLTFCSPLIGSVKDLTHIDGNVNEKKYLNKRDFRQILKLELTEPSKENVKSVAENIREKRGVLWAGANTYAVLESLPAAASGTLYPTLWGLHGEYGIDVVNAWNITTGSSSIKVGVIDTGIASHNDLNANVVAGWDFVNNNSVTTDDPSGHGTHVAGIIGATGANTNGMVGVNRNVSLVPLQVANGNYLSLDAAISAITWSASNSIDIINYSLGMYYEVVPLKTAINNYQGLFICSAGNYDINTDITRHYPSDYSQGQAFSDRVISVGAIKSDGTRPTAADWGYFNNDPEKPKGSNYGEETVSLFAPGDNIYSTGTNNNYIKKRGTSMAAPFVTGVASLMLSVNPNLTGAQIKQKILSNADNITISIPSGTQNVKKLNAFRSVASVAMETNNYGNVITDLYFTPSQELTMPDKIDGVTITGIDNFLFYSCTSMTSVTIPASVTNIGSSAFFNCTNLTEVNIPPNSSLATIGDWAFAFCTSLTNVNLPNQLTTIGNNAFYYCSSFTNITIPARVSNIGAYAFAYCTNLENVTFAPYSSLYTIGQYAFSWCYDLSEVNINILHLLSNVGSNCFYSTSNDLEIYIPNHLYDDYTDSSAWYDYYNNIVPMANSIIIEDLYPNSYIESNVWNGTDFWFSESLVDIYYYDYPDITYSEIFFYLGDIMDGYYFTMNDIEELTLYVNCDNYYDPDSGFELYNEDWDYITRCGIEEDYFVISLMDLLDYYDENTGLLHFYMYPEEDTLDCIWFYVQEIEIYIELSGAN